jgi:hypothetical protein
MLCSAPIGDSRPTILSDIGDFVDSLADWAYWAPIYSMAYVVMYGLGSVLIN